MASLANPVPAPTKLGPMKSAERRKGFLLALPAILWLGFFFVLPVFIVLVMSFLTPVSGGDGGQLPITLEHYGRAFDFFAERPIYSTIIIRSITISLITTVLCLLIGYPLAFFISTRQNPNMRNFCMFLIIMPFWTNFLVRTYALKTIIAPEGTLGTLLTSVGLLQGSLDLLNTREAVLLGLVYSYLPFMVLPIYASVERFDFRLVEAAHDLGANDILAFFRIVLPITLPGVIAGFILVFVPTIGAFVTPDLLGGTQGLMISNLIQTQFRGSGANYPRGSALSMVLMMIVTVGVIIYLKYGDRENA
jgi:spermidine/putrescine transport system permease protein